ncbi:MAG: spherulation-specific family 4 protein [Cystobacter sp.]
MARDTKVALPLLLLGLLLVSGCLVESIDEEGRACDTEHPCGSGRACFDGVCLAQAPPSRDGGPSEQDDGGSCQDTCVDRLCGSSNGCGTVCRPEAGCSEGSVLDGFDSADTGWVVFKDNATTFHQTVVSTPAQSGRATRLEYDINPAGGFGGIERLFGEGQDWRGATGLGLWIHGEATGHPFRLELYDTSRVRFEYKLPVDWTGWRHVYVPFTAFTLSDFQTEPDAGSSSPALDAVKGLSISPGFQSGAHGAVVVDELSLMRRPEAGAIVPLYIYPAPGAWAPLIEGKLAHPTVPVLAIVNPASGPGTVVDPAYASSIRALDDAGITVLGYVHALYSQREAALVREDIRRYRAFYPETRGIFIDEMANTQGGEDYYRALDAHARDLGFSLTVGNPGTRMPESYNGSVDVFTISEGPGLVAASELRAAAAGFERSALGILRYGLDTARPAYVHQVRRDVRYIYLTHDPKDPWKSLPPYLSSLLDSLR